MPGKKLFYQSRERHIYLRSKLWFEAHRGFLEEGAYFVVGSDREEPENLSSTPSLVSDFRFRSDGSGYCYKCEMGCW